MASHSTPRVSIYIPTGLNHRTKVCARYFNQGHLAHSPTSGRRMTTPKRTRSTTLVNGKDSIASWHYKTSTTSTRRPSSTESTPARITTRGLVAPPFRVPDRPEYNRRIPQVLPRSHRSPRRAPQPLGLFPVQSIVIRQTNCKTRLPACRIYSSCSIQMLTRNWRSNSRSVSYTHLTLPTKA